MAAQYPPQEGHNPAYQPQPAQDVPPQVHEAYPEPVKPQDQQYAGQVPPPGQPGGYYVQPQAPPCDNTHLLIAWIFFGVHSALHAVRRHFLVVSVSSLAACAPHVASITHSDFVPLCSCGVHHPPYMDCRALHAMLQVCA
jgi:hypothetical protein